MVGWWMSSALIHEHLHNNIYPMLLFAAHFVVTPFFVQRRQESEPALISVIFFISTSPERSEIPLVEKRERRQNCQSIMFDQERLDPHRVGNLTHVLTIKNKSSTFRVRIKCAYY